MDEVNFRVKEIDGVGGHGGIVANGMDNADAPVSHSKAFYTVTVKDIFLKFNVPHEIDYLSLDVEGAEEFIMEAFPFDDYTISLISVERVKEGLKNNLIVHGFKMVARLGEDTLWAHESAKDKLGPEKMSSYAKSLHDNDPKF
jgi:hypothetical protein